MHTEPNHAASGESKCATADGLDPTPEAHPGPKTTAHLIVHTDSGDACLSGRHSGETRLQRLRRLYWGGRSPGRYTPLALTLADRHGRELLSLADADPTLGIALVPGTYHLTATLGDIRRGYTLSLPADVRFELHLRFAAPQVQRPPATTSAGD